MSTPPDRAGLLSGLLDASTRLRNEAGLHADALAGTLELNRADLTCLSALILEGSVPAGRLAEVSGLTTGGISGVLDRLERAGLVERLPDPDDRRRVLVTLSPDRRDHVTAAFDALRHLDQALLEEYTDAELQFLLHHSERTLAALRQETRRLRGGDTGPSTEEQIFSAPRDARDTATLHLVGGGYELRIEAAPPAAPELFVARFAGGGVNVSTTGNDVTVRSRSRLLGGTTHGSLTLNPDVCWALRLRGGSTRITAALRDVPVSRIEISGGSGLAEFDLGPPTTEAVVHVDGGARQLTFRRPRGTPARLSLRGRLSDLRIDGDPRGSVIAHRAVWQTPDFDDHPTRYDIHINGGAISLELDHP
jgi:DNA-binding MarR family transcriptional regulator